MLKILFSMALSVSAMIAAAQYSEPKDLSVRPTAEQLAIHLQVRTTWPKEAGGTCGSLAYDMQPESKGTSIVYAWWCGDVPYWIGAAPESKPEMFYEEQQILTELKRLEVMQGYSRNPDRYQVRGQSLLKKIKTP